MPDFETGIARNAGRGLLFPAGPLLFKTGMKGGGGNGTSSQTAMAVPAADITVDAGRAGGVRRRLDPPPFDCL